MLNSIPKVINNCENDYFLQLHFTEHLIFVSYIAQYHGDEAVFSYWISYGNEELLIEKTLEFIQKWLYDGNVIVRQ